jgi:hypothetical protein
MMTKKKLKYQYKPPSNLDINLDDYGTFEDGPLPEPKDKSGVSLAPIGRDGKEIEWVGRGWQGVIEYAEALGLTSNHIGCYIEENFGNRTTFNQIMLAQQVHRSLEMIEHYREPRLNVAPKGLESDMHYAIRMDQVKIFKLYALCGGKAKNKFKAIGQMYNQVMKDRKEFVLVYKRFDELNKEQKTELAKAKSKANKSELFNKIIKKKS